ncbi:hypothetical protein GCM10025870_20800 [Agromyces marinus]|uniref:Uncharacterized protein n=1 Tax=Agromyces marinus TaxID=1389020 RepID=A0ABN6YGG4_9MICO|nr:hypothetical protein [Agromyces marinus]BDZ55007.1 hypothetical protein GCM10025870_20800 [Agromyces marinus]
MADAEGTGTTLATAAPGTGFAAHFGADSAARHRAAGFADLLALHPDAIRPGMRRDVDTVAELRDAVALGVGPRTTIAVRSIVDRSVVDRSGTRHPSDPSTAPQGAATAPDGADRKAAS